MAQREIYERSRDFDANPVEIIHAVTATLPECAHPHMPSDNTLRRNITAIIFVIVFYIYLMLYVPHHIVRYLNRTVLHSSSNLLLFS